MIKVCLIDLDEFKSIFEGKVNYEQCPVNLTKREIEILSGIAQGKSNSEIGKELFLSAYTVKNYVSQIIEKLEVKNRTQAAAKAFKYGLL